MAEFRSYHGTDTLKGMKWLFPHLSEADAAAMAAEFDAMPKATDIELEYQNAKHMLNWAITRGINLHG